MSKIKYERKRKNQTLIICLVRELMAQVNTWYSDVYFPLPF